MAEFVQWMRGGWLCERSKENGEVSGKKLEQK